MRFNNKYKFLSNFSSHGIDVDGVHYKTVEHYYQTMKTVIRTEREIIMDAATPLQAKRLGRKCTLRKNWDEMKYSTMELGINVKYDQHREIQKQLLNVEGEIIEHNNWGDTYWGKCNGVGQNCLGKIWMAIREDAWWAANNLE